MDVSRRRAGGTSRSAHVPGRRRVARGPAADGVGVGVGRLRGGVVGVGSAQRFVDGRVRRALLIREHRALAAGRARPAGLAAWPQPGLSVGPEMWEPLVVVVKALALAALCVYAVVGGVHDLLTGGRAVATGWALAYAVLATAGGVVVTLMLRRGGRSDLVRAEAAEWWGDTLLSVGVLIGFLVAVALVAAGRSDLAACVDPTMVVVVSVVFLRVPAKLVAGGLREMVSKAAPAGTLAELQACVDAVGQRFGLGESFLRAAKVGSRVDVEVDFVVGADSPVRTVADCDRVRQDLHDRLAALGHERSVIVAFTTDRKWAG